MYGILAAIGKRYGKDAMRRVLKIIQKYPEERKIISLKAGSGVADKSRMAIAEGLAEGSDRWLDPYPGMFMKYARGKVGNDPVKMKKVVDYARAKPKEAKVMSDWYRETGGESRWSQGFLDDFIRQAQRAELTEYERAMVELARIRRKPYTESAINKYLTKEYKKLFGE
tara:strand:- start:741 stop:1247 length:507 start_codon:yes stop_codon:yes gene_type:complete